MNVDKSGEKEFLNCKLEFLIATLSAHLLPEFNSACQLDLQNDSALI